MRLTRHDILAWLRESDDDRLAELWRLANEARRAGVGDAVYLRGLLEISNCCQRNCLYCGIRANRHEVSRYRMTPEEILDGARLIRELGYGTVVMQAGEDPELSIETMCEIIRTIKSELDLVVTLSLGELPRVDLAALREAGANRYLMRFETSNPELFELIHPPKPGSELVDRKVLLGWLRELGYEVGSGVMVGIPGQSYEDLAGDIAWFGKLDLDMIGVGPFIAHPDTPLGRHADRFRLDPESQVPNSELMTYKVLALTRITCPMANIPSTTALGTLNNESGYEHGLARGANVIMPNLTPTKYRTQYEIYPNKLCVSADPWECRSLIHRRIEAAGRSIGVGRGNSPNISRRTAGDGSFSAAGRTT